MNRDFEKYNSYSTTDFVLDDGFINWVLTPTEENIIFWRAFLLAYPQQNEKVEAAKQIVTAFQESVNPVTDDEKDEVWKIITREGRQAKVYRLFSLKRRLVAASVIAMITAGFLFFYTNAPHQKERIEATAIASNRESIAPGGQKAILTLADGSTVNLDGVAEGELSRQGAARLIILPGGKLSYEATVSNKKEISPINNTVATPRGGQYQLQLADGTRVWLNAASSISYPAYFSGSERRISIRGEAYFEVAHNEQSPFVVEANGLEVRVLGTRFNLNAYGDDGTITTTLLEGSVEAKKGSVKKVIKPGQQVVNKIGEDKLVVYDSVDGEAVLSWKAGYFEFSNLPLSVILNQISRWYDVDIILPNTLAAGEKYGGRISKNLPLDELLKLLESSGISFSIQGRKIIVTQMKNQP